MTGSWKSARKKSRRGQDSWLDWPAARNGRKNSVQAEIRFAEKREKETEPDWGQDPVGKDGPGDWRETKARKEMNPGGNLFEFILRPIIYIM